MPRLSESTAGRAFAGACRALRAACLAGALLLAPFAVAPGWAVPAYSNLFVFGDSLADSGNNAIVFDSLSGVPGALRTPVPIADPYLIPSYPYASGRYSNGPVWVEQLASSLGLSALPSLAGGSNFAFGGARVGPAGSSFPYSLLDQVASFMSATGGSAPGSALYVVEGGGNDARDALLVAAGGGDPTARIVAYALSMANIVGQLKSGGAQDILIWNVPDIGKIPAILALGAGVSAQASAMAMAMNVALDSALASLPAQWQQGLIRFDAFAAFNALFADPAAQGFSDVTHACAADPVCIASPGGTFFWDGIHPTTAGHALLAAAVLAELPEPATLLLCALALAALGLGRRTRQPQPAKAKPCREQGALRKARRTADR